MSNKPKADDVVAYYAEPAAPNGPPNGPFAARVLKVYEDEEKNQLVDLSVLVAAGTFKPKTAVRFAESPTKHCWSWPVESP